jgi:hypothetical protein
MLNQYTVYTRMAHALVKGPHFISSVVKTASLLF